MKCTVPSKTLRAEVQPGVWADARRAVFIEPLQTLVVADLHWGYASSHLAAGNLLPAWGDEEIARQLLSLISEYRPREMIWLGDSLHALPGRAAAENFLREHAGAISTVLVAGNHDRKWNAAMAREWRRDVFFFHHGDATPALPENVVEIVGHFHPAVSWYDGAGGRLKIPALVASARRLILPAFSPWAAGVPWNDKLQENETLWAIAPSRVFAVKGDKLRSS